jgi:hypothetical protein
VVFWRLPGKLAGTLTKESPLLLRSLKGLSPRQLPRTGTVPCHSLCHHQGDPSLLRRNRDDVGVVAAAVTKSTVISIRGTREKSPRQLSRTGAVPYHSLCHHQGDPVPASGSTSGYTWARSPYSYRDRNRPHLRFTSAGRDDVVVGISVVPHHCLTPVLVRVSTHQPMTMMPPMTSVKTHREREIEYKLIPDVPAMKTS